MSPMRHLNRRGNLSQAHMTYLRRSDRLLWKIGSWQETGRVYVLRAFLTSAVLNLLKIGLIRLARRVPYRVCSTSDEGRDAEGE